MTDKVKRKEVAMEQRQKELLVSLVELLDIPSGCQFLYLCFRRGGIYPMGVHQSPSRYNDSATIVADHAVRSGVENIIRELHYAGLVEYYCDGRSGDSGDGPFGCNPWYRPGTLLDESTVHLSDEAVDFIRAHKRT